MLFWFIVLGPMLLITVLIHELGHCLAARQVRCSKHQPGKTAPWQDSSLARQLTCSSCMGQLQLHLSPTRAHEEQRMLCCSTQRPNQCVPACRDGFGILTWERYMALLQVGGEAHGILLWPLGGLAFIGHDKGPKGDAHGSARLCHGNDS